MCKYILNQFTQRNGHKYSSFQPEQVKSDNLLAKTERTCMLSFTIFGAPILEGLNLYTHLT